MGKLGSTGLLLYNPYKDRSRQQQVYEAVLTENHKVYIDVGLLLLLIMEVTKSYIMVSYCCVKVLEFLDEQPRLICKIHLLRCTSSGDTTLEV